MQTNTNVVTTKFSQATNERIIALINEFDSHLDFVSRVYQKVAPEKLEEKNRTQVHKAAMIEVEKLVRAAYGKLLKEPEDNNGLLKELLDKVRKEIMPQAHHIMMQHIVKKTGCILNQNDLNASVLEGHIDNEKNKKPQVGPMQAHKDLIKHMQEAWDYEPKSLWERIKSARPLTIVLVVFSVLTTAGLMLPIILLGVYDMHRKDNLRRAQHKESIDSMQPPINTSANAMSILSISGTADQTKTGSHDKNNAAIMQPIKPSPYHPLSIFNTAGPEAETLKSVSADSEAPRCNFNG